MFYIYTMETQSNYDESLYTHLTAMNEGLRYRVFFIDKRMSGYGHSQPLTGSEFRSLMADYCLENDVYLCEIEGVKKFGRTCKMLQFTEDQIKGFEDVLQYVDVRVRSREADAYQAKLVAEYHAKKAAKEVPSSFNVAA